jgi:hypothetical protein
MSSSRRRRSVCSDSIGDSECNEDEREKTLKRLRCSVLAVIDDEDVLVLLGAMTVQM